MDIPKEIKRIAKELISEDVFDSLRNTKNIPFQEMEKRKKYLRNLINIGLGLPDNPSLDFKEIESVGAIRYPDPDKNGKWKIFVKDENMKKRLKDLIKAKGPSNKGFSVADLKKPAMLNSKGK